LKGYLIDNNTLDPLFKKHPTVMRHFNARPANASLYLSAVVIGEISFGHEVNPIANAAGAHSRAAFNQWLDERFDGFILPVTRHTGEPYAYLRSNLFNKFLGKSQKVKRPDQLIDPVSGSPLGIDENDLWMCAQAIEHNLVFVSNDKIANIKNADVQNRLAVENWLL
jgi:predicted nucleic acid-binding protein